MRSETSIDGRECLCIWMKEGAKHMNSATQAAFTSAVRMSGIGKTQVKRDFLSGQSTDTFIKKQENNVRQSCTAVFFDMLPHELSMQLKKSMFLNFDHCMLHFLISSLHLHDLTKVTCIVCGGGSREICCYKLTQLFAYVLLLIVTKMQEQKGKCNATKQFLCLQCLMFHVLAFCARSPIKVN